MTIPLERGYEPPAIPYRPPAMQSQYGIPSLIKKQNVIYVIPPINTDLQYRILWLCYGILHGFEKEAEVAQLVGAASS